MQVEMSLSPSQQRVFSMIEIVGTSNIYLYADDLKLYQEINSEESVNSSQSKLDKMYDWTRYSLLRFHPQKCVVMRLGENTKKLGNINSYYAMDETRVKIVDTEKDLGIIFDSHMSFDEHITTVVKKANSIAGMIRRTFVHLDKNMFKTHFSSMVRPHLEYGAPIWNPHLRKHITTIENVQRRASRQIPGMSHLSYTQRLKILRLPTLSYIRYRGDMLEMYKITHGHYDADAVEGFLEFRAEQAPSRSFRSHEFHVKKATCKKDVRRFAFKQRVADQWNNLLKTIVEASTINTFKNRLDKLWEQNDVMYDPDIDLFAITSSRRTRYEEIKL